MLIYEETDETDETPVASRAKAGLRRVGKRFSYLTTHKGLVLSAEIVLGLIVLISFSSTWRSGCIAVPILEMILSAGFLGVFWTKLDNRTFTELRWARADNVRAAVGTVLYLVATVATVARGYGSTAGAAFSLIAAIVFAYDTYCTILMLKTYVESTEAKI